MPRVCVLYPEEIAPYREVFQEILAGIAERLGDKSLCADVLASDADPTGLTHWLRENAPDLVVTLGRRATRAYESSGARLPYLIGALDISPQTRPDASGLSVLPDPEQVFARLIAIAPGVKRVRVVYDPKRDGWLIDQARAAAAAQGLTLEAAPASGLEEAAPKYGEFVRTARSGVDAVWLTSNTALSGDRSLLAYLIEQAWLRRVIVFSNTLAHAEAGVLFAVYPDAHALGERLAEMALARARGTDKRPRIELARALKTALNARIARHLGLLKGAEPLDRFDLVVDNTGGIE